jgi:hypothetical protein
MDIPPFHGGGGGGAPGAPPRAPGVGIRKWNRSKEAMLSVRKWNGRKESYIV